MSLYVKDAGVWKTIKNIFVKNTGNWSTVKKGWVKNGGVWQQFYNKTVSLSIASQNNINLRTYYSVQTGDSSSNSVEVVFTVQGNIGSTSTSTAALSTGSWPTGSSITLIVPSGFIIAGCGGRGATSNANGSVGGPAINLNYNITIQNSGIIGGGGGGGGGAYGRVATSLFTPSYNYYGAAGGGGAGINAGLGNSGNQPNGNCTSSAGNTSAGGNGCQYYYSSNLYFTGGNGGSLGESGTTGTGYRYGPLLSFYTYSGGAAGKCIDLNGKVVTWSPQGTTYGVIS